LRINLDMRPPRALPAAHFDRNESYAYFGDRALVELMLKLWPPAQWAGSQYWLQQNPES